jgi:hypothetical protein
MSDTVTVFTAGRMQEIEDTTIVDGDVVGDNLHLTTRAGTVIDAGNVRGPQGIQGPQGGPGDTAATANTWAIRGAGGRLKVGTPTANDDAVNKSTFDTLNNIVKGVELDGSTNLNTLLTAGMFFQSEDAQATLALNYPVASLGGTLEVMSSGGTRVIQQYRPLVNPFDSFYIRSYTGSAWSPWARYSAEDDTGWITASTAGFTASTGASLTSGFVRKRNGLVAVNLAGLASAAYAAGNITNVNLWTIPSGWIPQESNGTINAGATGPSFAAFAANSGLIVMSNTDTGFGVGAGIQGTGVYML